MAEFKRSTPEERKECLTDFIKGMLEWVEGLNPEDLTDGTLSVENIYREAGWSDDGWNQHTQAIGKDFSISVRHTPKDLK